MSQSLAPECTPLKHSYDACFNAWFEGYLEPAIAAGSSGGSGKNGSTASPKAREEYSAKKAEEFEKNCGEVWRQYRTCVQGAVKEKGLDEMLKQAREDNPLKEPPLPSTSQSSSKS